MVAKYFLYIFLGNRLNEYILHYETLDYDASAVHAQHSRVRRSLDSSSDHVHLEFHSHGKPFRLKLARDTATFSPDVEIVSHKGEPIDVDTSHLYQGHLQGDGK